MLTFMMYEVLITDNTNSFVVKINFLLGSKSYGAFKQLSKSAYSPVL